MAKNVAINVNVNTNFDEVDQDIESIISSTKTLKQQFKELSLAAATATDPEVMTKYAKAAGKLKDQIGDANQQIKNFASDTRKLDTALGVVQGLAGGFAAVQGAQALLGGENEKLNESLQKVMGSLTVLNGIQQVANTLNKDSVVGAKLYAAANKLLNGSLLTASKGLSTFKKALIGTGIGAVVVALGLLIANFEKISKLFDDFSGKQKQAAEDAKKRADAELEAYNHLTSQDNVLKLQGKTEKEILKLKIQAVKTAIDETTIRLQAEIDLAKKEQERITRNRAFWAQVKGFFTGDYSFDFPTLDETSIKEAEAQIAKLENDWAGYELAVLNIGKETNKKIVENNQKKIDDIKAILEKERTMLLEGKEKELEELKIQYEKDLAAYEKLGIDTSKLTEKYAKDRNEINEKYRKEDIENLEKTYEKYREIYDKIYSEVQVRKSDRDISLEKEKWERINQLIQDGISRSEATEIAGYEESKRLRESNIIAILESITLQQDRISKIQTGTIPGTSEDIEKLNAEILKLSNELYINQAQLLDDQDKLDEYYTNKKKERLQAYQDFAVNVTYDGLNTIADLTDAFEKSGRISAKKAFKIQQGVAISEAVISTILSAQKAYQSQFNPVAEVSSPVRGTIAAALAVAAGVARIAKIKAQQFDDGGGSGSVSAPPAANVYSPIANPFIGNGASSIITPDTTKTPQYQQMRVWVAETDITNTQNKVKVIENHANAKF